MSAREPKTTSSRTGASHLERQSRLRKRILDERISPRMLLVEDHRLDVYFIETPLRRLFGADARIDIATSVVAMTAALAAHSYDVLLLDDLLDADTTADQTLPLVRARQPDLPIIAFSHLLTRKRLAELQRHNCHLVLGKDELDSVVLCEAILSAIGRGT